MQCLTCGIAHPPELECSNVNKELIDRIARKIRGDDVEGEALIVSRQEYKERAVVIATCMLLHREYHDNFERINALLEDDEIFWGQVEEANDVISFGRKQDEREDVHRVGGDVRPPGVCRQLSEQSDGVLCVVCSDELASTQRNSLRLACQCVVHYACLLDHICYSFVNRAEKVFHNGICCPVFSKKGSVCKAHAVDAEGTCTPTFVIGPEDLEFLGKYGDTLPIETTEGLEMITVDWIDKLHRWLSSPRPVTPRPSVTPSLDPYMEVTTKPCPNPDWGDTGCTNRQTHFHGKEAMF